MKKIVLSLIVLASSISALHAQNNMVIHQGNGSTLSLPLQSIDSVRFNLVPPPALKRIFQNNGNILSLSVKDIDSITYTIPNRSTLPTLTTQAVTVLSSSSAFGGGNISADGGSAVTQRGVCWNTSPNPTLANNFTADGTGLGSYGSTMQPLTPATTYYVRAFATNANGTSYGSQVSFVTATANNNGNMPTISTNQVVYMDSLSAFCGGNITADGGLAVTARGVCWAIGTTPTINQSRTIDGAGGGSFNSRLANLLPNTSYFVRAYATNDAGTAYGITFSFTTKGFATVATDSVFDIKIVTAHVQGTIVSDGGASVSQRGFCWSNSPNPTINDSIIEGGFAQIYTLNAVLSSADAGRGMGGDELEGDLIHISGTNPGCGQISIDLTGKIALIERGGCTFREKVVSAQNAGAKGVIVFQNSGDEPFSMGGTENSNGGQIPSVMISRVNGLELVKMLKNQSLSARIFETSVTVSRLVGANQFVSQITNLLPDTLYYLRSFAKNNVGVSYGNTITFLAIASPTIITNATKITSNSATFGGAINNALGYQIEERGIVYSTTPNPTLGSNDKIRIGKGIGTFETISDFELLQSNTTFYIRAYAVVAENNISVSAYGNEVSFTTLSVGQAGRGGGIVFFDKGDTIGGWQYLETATSDQSTGLAWGCSVTSIPGTQFTVGSGEANTSLIVAGCNEPSFAAKLCNDLVLGGQTDWFLPSRNELFYMRKNLYTNNQGNFTTGAYWSSTEAGSDNTAILLSFDNSVNTGSDGKANAYRVRAVRAF